MGIELKARDAIARLEKAFDDKKLIFFDEELMGKPEGERGNIVMKNERGFVCAFGAMLPDNHGLDPDSVSTTKFYKELVTEDEDLLADLDGMVCNCCFTPSVATAKKFFKTQLTAIKEKYKLS